MAAPAWDVSLEVSVAYRSKESSGPPGMEAAVVAGAVLSLVVGLGIFWAQSQRAGPSESEYAAPRVESGEHPLAFPPLRIDEGRLADSRREKYGEAREALKRAGEPHRKLIGLVRQANAAQFGNSEIPAQALTAQISATANEVIPYTTYDGFPAAGRPVFEACREGLSALQEALGSGDLTPKQAREHPEGPEFDSYRQNCGQLYGTLVDRGLMEERGRWSEPVSLQRDLFEILQRYRWAHIIRSRRQPHLQLTEYERRLFFRWRIEDPEAFPQPKRQEFLSRVREDPSLIPDYDVPMAAARLAWGTGRPEEAADVLRSGIEAHPQRAERYRRALTWLKTKAEGEG